MAVLKPARTARDMSNPRPANVGWIWLVASLVALLGSYVAFAPLRTRLPATDLDSSWVAVLGEAGVLGLAVGEDIVFTGGPLSSLYTGYLDEHLVWLKLGLRFLLVVGSAYLIILLACTNRRPIAAIFWGLGLVTLTGPQDALFLSLPLLTALTAITGGHSRFQLLAFCLGIFATAAATLAKFSVAPLAIIAFLLTDALRIYWRRPPIHLLGYAVALFALFSVVERPPSFIPYLVNSLSVAAGYTDAMSLAGPEGEPIGFLVVAAMLVGAISASEANAFRDGKLSLPNAVARATLLGAYLYFVWKLGFVRHDLHSLTAWSGLALATLTYVLIAPSAAATIRGGWFPCVFVTASAFCILLAIIPAILAYARPSPLFEFHRHLVTDRAHLLAEAKEFIAAPTLWLERRRSEKQAALEAIKRNHPLPQLDGSVDVIPSIQSTVLANGLRYLPRPSFQEYGTYTPWLIGLNHSSLVEHGPDYLLFHPGSIDLRYPAMAEGPLWPEILRHYEPSAMSGELLVLARRAQPLPDSLLGPEIAVKTRFGTDVTIPGGGNPQFMTVSIRKTMLGHIASLLIRPSLIFMEVTYEGRKELFRIIPAIGDEGFLISPAVFSAREFLLVGTGRSSGALLQVSRLRFKSGRYASLLYHPEINLTFRTLAEQPLRNQTLPQNIRDEADESWALLKLRKSVPPQAGVSFVPEGLLAHPPIALSLRLERPAFGIVATYGIREGAWQFDPGTDGVCFRIAVQHQRETRTLFERCLDPHNILSDRGESKIHLLQECQTGDIMIFETRCRGNCSYDWSYWSHLRLIWEPN